MVEGQENVTWDDWCALAAALLHRDLESVHLIGRDLAPALA